jgi:hypothetical protein
VEVELEDADIHGHTMVQAEAVQDNTLKDG